MACGGPDDSTFPALIAPGGIAIHTSRQREHGLGPALIAALGLFLLPPVSGHVLYFDSSQQEEVREFSSIFNVTASASPHWGNAPLTVYFGSQVSGGVAPHSFRWELGDGTSVGIQNPNHTYRSAGRFVVRLDVSDAAQSKANSTPITIDVAETLPWITAAGEGMPRHGTAPLVVQFRNWASGGLPPYSFAWDFGDGSPAAWTSNPIHVYASPGDYFASVTAFDSQNPPGADSSDLLPVTVSQPVDPLSVTAAAGPTEGTAPLSVSFSGSAAGGATPYSYFWDFGDGNGAGSENATHVYSRVDEYFAVLVASDSAGRRGASPPIKVKVGIGGGELAVTASAMPESGPAPLEVTFSAMASGGAPHYLYRWDFGDGGEGFGAAPSYVYRIPGTFLASVEVTDGVGDTSNSTWIGIRVAPRGNFTVSAGATPFAGRAPLQVDFTGEARGAVEPRWEWTFGDGVRAVTKDPIHVYDSAGSFWAVLTVTDRDGTMGSARVRIEVTRPSPITMELVPGEWIGEVGGMREFVARVVNESGTDVTGASDVWWEPPAIGRLNSTSGARVVMTAASPGNGTLKVRAHYDGFQAVSVARIEVRPSPPVPVVRITAPVNGSHVRGLVDVHGTVQSMAPIDKVQVRLNNNSWIEALPVDAGWTSWRSMVDLSGMTGDHTISARALAGGLLSEEMHVRVMVVQAPEEVSRPSSWVWGLSVAGLAILASLAFLWMRHRRRRKPTQRVSVGPDAVDLSPGHSKVRRARAATKAAGSLRGRRLPAGSVTVVAGH